MAGDRHDDERTEALRRTVVGAGGDEVRAALSGADRWAAQLPAAVGQALRALRRQRDPAAAAARPPYRVALPTVAALVSDACLEATVAALGEDAEDPTKEQLEGALAEVRTSYPDATIAVMLASAAVSDMPASDLCFELVTSDPRYGLAAPGPSGPPGPSGAVAGVDPGTEAVSEDDAPTGRPPEHGAAFDHGAPLDGDDPVDGEAPVDDLSAGPAPPAGARRPAGDDDPSRVPDEGAKREARRSRKRLEADARRRQEASARQARERLRSARKRERAKVGAAESVDATTTSPDRVTGGGRSGPARRRTPLTPLQASEFDAADPWVGAVVLVWVPFASGDEEPGDGAPDAGSSGDPDGEAPDTVPGDGKERPVVVVAVSPTHLLVRPGYSEGGVHSRRWTSVALRQWRRAGLDRPTWIEGRTVRVPRPPGAAAPLGWLVADDWNALW